MPSAPAAAPKRVERTSIRANESVSKRAVVAGMTSVAAMSVTPTMLIEATIVAASASANRVSTSLVGTPKIGRHLRVEGHEQQPLVEQRDEHRDRRASRRR